MLGDLIYARLFAAKFEPLTLTVQNENPASERVGPDAIAGAALSARRVSACSCSSGVWSGSCSESLFVVDP
jgi:hypothetical protein